MAIVARRTTMTLYSDANDVYSHQVRIVLAEKGVETDIMSEKKGIPSEELSKINPYRTLPVLVDRDLVLYSTGIILEYLDERFPHPPLLPVYPIARAESRKMMYRIDRDWYALLPGIYQGKDAEIKRKILYDSLVGLEPVFADKPYFLSEEFSLLDCVLAPLLWRLSELRIEIPAKSKYLHAYMQKIFQKESFQKSLTEMEKQLRVA